MKNCWICILTLVMAFHLSISYAQSTSNTANKPCFKIRGEIHLKAIKKNGELYIMLVTEETFKTPLHSFKRLILKIGQKEIKEKKFLFNSLTFPLEDTEFGVF